MYRPILREVSNVLCLQAVLLLKSVHPLPSPREYNFQDYQLADLIGACQLMQTNQDEFTLKTVNKKAYLKHEDELYLYRRKRVVKM